MLLHYLEKIIHVKFGLVITIKMVKGLMNFSEINGNIPV